MRARRWLLATYPLAGLLLWASGCEPNTVLELRREITSLKDRIETQNNQIAAQQATIAELNKQYSQVRGLTDEDLERIFHPQRIVIDSLSGGDDYDGQPGDDGITVYLKPVDRDGDAVKVAGDIRIELYDLENPAGEKLIGEYSIPVDQVHELWYGKFATYHYTIRCPWLNGPPRHNEITIRAKFRDYLTQRVMTAQSVCTVNPAP